MTLAHTYDEIADDWNNEHKNSTWWMQGVDAFLAMVPKGGSVLDVGCGPGMKAKYIVDRGFVVTGVDISSRMIDLAQDSAPNATFAVHDVRAIAELGVFDGVMLFASLLHIPKKEVDDVLTGVYHSLADGGTVYIVVKQVYDNMPEEIDKIEEIFGKTVTRFFSHFTAHELHERLTRAGFSDVHIVSQPEGRTVWLHVYAKK